jgi:hypothetical protein
VVALRRQRPRKLLTCLPSIEKSIRKIDSFKMHKNPAYSCLQKEKCSYAWLDGNPLHLIQGNLIPGPVIELRRPWRLMRGYRLGVLNRSPVFQVCGYLRCLESVITRRRGSASFLCSSFYPRQHILSIHRLYASGCAPAEGVVLLPWVLESGKVRVKIVPPCRASVRVP